MTRVLLDATYAERAAHSGTAVYIERLLSALAELDGIEVRRVSNSRRSAPAGGGLGSARNLLEDRRWKREELPRLAREHRADVIHHPLPAVARAPGVAQAITVHDLAFELLPEHFDRGFRLYARRAHRRAALTAGAVICVSEATARDARALWGIAADRIVVAHHGPGQALIPGPPVPARHFLYVGDDEPRKDLGTLLAAYELYRASADEPRELVLAGNLERGSRAPGVRVERTPDLATLSELYREAIALVHPSVHEGFGMTALEAMSLGTPVLCAGTDVAHELYGEGALYAGAGDAASFAGAMARIAVSDELRGDLAAHAVAQAAEYSWAASARAHAAAYSLAVAVQGR